MDEAGNRKYIISILSVLLFFLISIIVVFVYPLYIDSKISENFEENKAEFKDIEMFLRDKNPLYINILNHSNIDLRIWRTDTTWKPLIEVYNVNISDRDVQIALEKNGWKEDDISFLKRKVENINCNAVRYNNNQEFIELIFVSNVFGTWSYILSKNKSEYDKIGSFGEYQKLNFLTDKIVWTKYK